MKIIVRARSLLSNIINNIKDTNTIMRNPPPHIQGCDCASTLDSVILHGATLHHYGFS